MIKILFLSDTHLGHDYPIRPTKRTHRGQDFFDNFEYILKYALENRVDIILHGGDFFFRTRIHEAVISKAYKILYDFSKYNIPFVIVPGNHESSRLPRSPLIFQPNIYIFKEPSSFHFNIKGFQLNISGFPYHKEKIRDEFPKIVRHLSSGEKKADINLLIHHHAVEGCTCGPGNYTFRHNKDVIQMKDIPMDYDAVLCGHIHRQQILWKEEKGKKLPILYAGSIERTSFAEKEETKGFFVFEFEKDKQSWQFIPLKSRPMIDLSIPLEISTKDQLENYLIKHGKSLENRSIVRIESNKEEIRKLLSSGFLAEIFKTPMITEVSGWKHEFKARNKKERSLNLFNL